MGARLRFRTGCPLGSSNYWVGTDLDSTAQTRYTLSMQSTDTHREHDMTVSLTKRFTTALHESTERDTRDREQGHIELNGYRDEHGNRCYQVQGRDAESPLALVN